MNERDGFSAIYRHNFRCDICQGVATLMDFEHCYHPICAKCTPAYIPQKKGICSKCNSRGGVMEFPDCKGQICMECVTMITTSRCCFEQQHKGPDNNTEKGTLVVFKKCRHIACVECIREERGSPCVICPRCGEFDFD